MLTKNSPVRSWQESPVRDSNEVRRWRSLVATPSLVLGIDEQGNWMQFVPQTGNLIPAVSEKMLFFLPMLDMEYAEFALQLTCAIGDDEELCAGASDLIQKVLSLALRQRAPPYIERALLWLDHIVPNDETRKALDEFAHGNRGTQRLRQAAFSILRRRGI
ncbi:hypothetical protein [Sorangium cellulosum]|uniref:hypothetical protein n=1 Tax=Sorangium cellulosum TaxID=56 RepID=UPI0013311950|nr:hypothetical protein [Sorangium cellulosum]